MSPFVEKRVESLNAYIIINTEWALVFQKQKLVIKLLLRYDFLFQQITVRPQVEATTDIKEVGCLMNNGCIEGKQKQ